MISTTAFLSAISLAQTPSVAPGGLQGIFGNSFMFPVLMIVMLYFILIRPQQRQRKEMAVRMAALQTSDKVVTSSGIHGIIHSIKDSTVMVKVAEGTFIEFDKTAVTTVQKKDAAK